MNKFESAFARWIINHRAIAIIVPLLLVAALASGLPTLHFDSSYRVFFGKDNPQLIAFESLEDTYTKNDNVVIVLAPSDENVFTSANLSAVEQLTTASWQIPYSSRVDSITNFQRTVADQDDLIVADMITGADQMATFQIDDLRTAVFDEPALRDRLISPSGHVTGIALTFQIPIEQRTAATNEIVAAVREMTADFQTRHPQFEVYLTGMVFMDAAFSESAIFDSSTLLPGSFVLMAVLLALLVGSFVGTFVTLLLIVCSVAAAMGFAGLVGFPLTSVTTSTPIIILTVAVANAVHVLVTYIHGLREGSEKQAAMEESLRVNVQPVFLASATTAIGFLTMNFSEVPPFGHLGTMVSVGVGVSFVLTVAFLPALMTLLPARVTAASGDDYTRMDRLAEFVIKRRRQLLWGMLTVIVVCVANLPRNELNDVFVHYFGESIKFRQDTDFLMNNLTGIYTLGYSLDSGDSGGISNPDYQRDVETFSQWLEAQPETVHVDRFTTIMKKLNKNMHADNPDYYRLPNNRDLGAQYLLLYEMSLPYGLDLNNQINVDKSSSKVTLTLKLISSNEMVAFDRRAHEWLEANAPAVKRAESAGTILMFSNIGQRNIRAMLIGTSLALILISGILVIALRSMTIGGVSLVPNLIPAAVGFGLWGVVVGEVGLSLSIVTGMTFGIVVDDTVHFLSKYLRARREQGLGPNDAVRYAFHTVGRALTVTTVVLVAGFMVLAMSSFEVNSAMGLMTAAIITIALICAFLLLPPLLMKIEENRADATPDRTDANRPATA
ncbi:MAG: efflux RND transporter permease subunit [Gammaproteobacteria bacterium]